MRAAPLRFDGRALLDAADEPAAWPRFGVLGHPIAHSLSPVLHGAALRATGQSGDYRAVDVEPNQLEALLACSVEAGTEGWNLTVPLKVQGLTHVPRRSDEVEEVGATNTLVARGGAWHAHNTDVRGLALALERARGPHWTRHLRRVDVIGAGGAARAAVACLRGLGASRIRLWARRPAAASWATAAGVEIAPLEQARFAGSELVLQCTSLGLSVDDPSPVVLDALDAGALCYDLVYADRPTAFLREAASRGARVEDGRSMLVAQAALSFGMWTGEDPPLVAMAVAIGMDWMDPTSREES